MNSGSVSKAEVLRQDSSTILPEDLYGLPADLTHSMFSYQFSKTVFQRVVPISHHLLESANGYPPPMIDSRHNQRVDLGREGKVTGDWTASVQLQRRRAETEINALKKLNDSLHRTLLARDAGLLCLHEIHEGIVTHVLDDQVVVRYETEDEPIEQIYDKQQFITEDILCEGAYIEAHCFAWVRPPKSQEISEILTPEQIQVFKDVDAKRLSGPLEI